MLEHIGQQNLNKIIGKVVMGEDFQKYSFEEELEAIIARMNGDSSLDEKLIMFNQGKKYGQAVFLAGGAGSGKGFATKNFMEGEKFKIRDVDEWKKAFMAISKLQRDSTDWEGNINSKYFDSKGRLLGDLDLKNPEHVFALHMAVKKIGVKNKSLNLLLQDLNKRHLPNILFDITLKETEDITEVIPKLTRAGYEARNTHLVWVLANYHVAVKANAERERVVPDDILLQTHEGAANTMYSLIRSKGVPGLNGGVHVILANRENTVFWQRSDGSKTSTIKEFTYLTIKPEGKDWNDQEEVNQQVLDWIKDNVPRSDATKGLWSDPPTVPDTDYPDDDEFGDMETATGAWKTDQSEDDQG